MGNEADKNCYPRLIARLIRKYIQKRRSGKNKSINAIDVNNPYNDFINILPSPLLIINSETGSILNANRAATDFYGYDEEEFKKLFIRDIDQFPENIENMIMQDFCSGRENHILAPHKLKNGEIRVVDVFAGLIYYNSKKYIVAIIHDCTKKYDSGRKFIKKFEINKAILGALTETALVYDKSLNIKYFKAGDSPGSLFNNVNPVGMNLNDLNIPDTTIRDSIEVLRTALKTLEINYLSHNFEYKGKTYYNTSKIVPLDDNYVLILVQDITEAIEHGKTEMVYKFLFENLYEAAGVIDISTKRLTDINKAFKDMFGYAKEDIIKMNLNKLIVSDFHSKDILNKDINELHCCKLRCANGEFRYCDIKVMKNKINGRQVAICFIKDVTDLMNLEINLYSQALR